MSDPTVNIMITSLLMFGGIGNFSNHGCLAQKKLKLSLHTKDVLLFTLLLNIAGTLIIFGLSMVILLL